MASTFNIPKLTIQQGQTIFGPAAPGAGLQGLILTLDIGVMVPAPNALDVRIEHSEDSGATYRLMSETSVDGPATVKGVLQTDMTLEANLGMTAAGPILTTAATRVRAIVTSNQAFLSNGGSLVTY